MSTATVQQIAAAAAADGCDHADVVFLSTLGSSDKYPKNMHKELNNKFRPSPLRESIDEICVWQKKSSKPPIHVHQKIMLPHRVFAALHKHYYNVFKLNIMGGNADEPGRFWEAMQGNPVYHNHPVSKRGTHKTHAIPFALHGDAVATSGCGKSWAKSCEAYSWRSLLSMQANAITSNYLIWRLLGKLLLKGGNLHAFNVFERKLTWSLYWLFLGRWLTRDEFGVEYAKDSTEGKLAHEEKWLAGGYFGVLWLLQGDLEHMAKAWGFANSGSIGHDRNPCACCLANGNDEDKPWTDGRLDVAAWTRIVFTNATWAAAFPNRSYIFRNLPGLGIEQCVPDVMHVLHLGCYQYVFGSCLALLTHHHMPAAPEQNLEVIWGRIKQYYKERM
jgi:hypothetical protein